MTQELQKVEVKESAIVTPNVMLAMAVEKGADIDQLSKLMDLQDRWEKSEAKKAFVSAMSQFRAECISVAKTRSGHNCKYAGLAETIEQVSPVLVKCGLSHRWETKQDNNQITVTCHLTHIMGHSETATMTSGADTSGGKNSIQAIGSAISYLQRYTFFAVTGLASREMDDDGSSVGIHVISDEQLANLEALISELGDKLDRKKFDKWLASRRVNSLDMLPSKMYGEVVSTLEAKRK